MEQLEAYPALLLAPISEQDAKNAVESDKFTPNFSGLRMEMRGIKLRDNLLESFL